MAIAIRTEREIEKLRDAGRIVGKVLNTFKEIVKPGMTTAELAEISDTIIADSGAIAIFKGVPNPGYPDFPASICASVNEEVVHGIPGPRVLNDGDIISIDCGTKLKGYCGDAAVTIPVGTITPEVQKLLDVTSGMLDIVVENSKPGIKWSEIAAKMQKLAEDAGFGVVQEYVGHGIGREMHEDPKIPNFVSKELLRNDLLLRKGMVLAVEPMVNMGTWRCRTLSDGWTVVSGDGTPSAHFEHTIAITENGCEVLTLAN